MSVNRQGVRSTIDFAKHSGCRARHPRRRQRAEALHPEVRRQSCSRDSSRTTNAALSDSAPDVVTGRRLPAALLESLPTQQTDSRPHAR